MAFIFPYFSLFFNHCPFKLIVACGDNIFIVNVRTQSTQPFSSTPQGAYYYPHALALSDDDAVLVVGNSNRPFNACRYDTSSFTRLWVFNTASHVGAVKIVGAHVLVTVYGNPTLVLDLTTGAHLASLQKAEGFICGLGMIEGLLQYSFLQFILRPQYLRVPRHFAAPPLQACESFPSAAGDVGLDREVSRVAVVFVMFSHIIHSISHKPCHVHEKFGTSASQ